MNHTKDSINDSLNDFFAEAFANGPLKYFSIAATILFLIFLIPSGYGIIWYEHYGADSKRILINRCVASVCWTGIEFYVIVLPIDIIRYIFGPLPEGVCLFQLLLKNVINVQTVLFCDAVSMARYLFIFYIKNPYKFQDEFWHTLINIWVVSFAIMTQFVFVYLPGHQPLNFFLCSGKNPTVAGKVTTVKKNYVFSLILILSIFLQVSVAVKLISHRLKLDSKTTYAYIDNFRKENSFDIFMCSSFLAIAIIYGYLLFSMQTMEPALINVYPNFLFVYGLHFGFPIIGCATFTLLFYAKNKHLTVTFWGELIDLLR
jgi:hypothetical protein